VPVDIENRRTVVFRVDHVRVPQFVVESLCHGMRGSIDFGLLCRSIMPRRTRLWAPQSRRKPIKNSELGGSGDTCISVTRQRIAWRARCNAVHIRGGVESAGGCAHLPVKARWRGAAGNTRS
jgi:hypothetical protein